MFAFFMLYFIQKFTNNFQGISKIPLRHFLGQPVALGGAGLDPSAAGAFLTTAALGWYIKPLFGVVTDHLPLFGTRRKSWIIISLLVSAWLWTLVPGLSHSVSFILGVIILLNVAISFSDVACDGLMLDCARSADRVAHASSMRGNRPLQLAQNMGAAIAMIAVALLTGWVMKAKPIDRAASASAVLAIAGAVITFFLVKESKQARVSAGFKKALRGIGIAILTGGTVCGLKALPAQNPLHTWEPFISPLLVIAATFVAANFQPRIMKAAALMLLWNLFPFNIDTQYVFQFITQDAEFDILRSGSGSSDWMPFKSLLMGTDDGASDPIIFLGSVLGVISQLGIGLGLLFVWMKMRSSSTLDFFRCYLVGTAICLVAFALIMHPSLSSPLALVCGFTAGGFVTALGNAAVLFYSAKESAGTESATSFALLMGISNFGSMLGSECIGGWIYSSVLDSSAGGGSPYPAAHAMGAVLIATAVFLIPLYKSLVWLERSDV